MNDISFSIDNNRFNYRVAGVILDADRILVMTESKLPYYYLPGGRVQWNETSIEAIRREIQEELNAISKSEKLLWISENFFKEASSNEKFHEICFYYAIEIENIPEFSQNSAFTRSENGKILQFTWMRLDDLENHKVFPEFLKDAIRKDRTGIQHIISR